MTLKPFLTAALLAGTAFMTVGANSNWNTTVTLTNGGHIIGNPKAKLKLTEYISYTCPHCADFAREGEAPLQIAFIGPGKGSLEVRHLVRDQIDLTAALLAWCGNKSKFPGNHAAFMLRQSKWLETAQRTTAGQRARWVMTKDDVSVGAIAISHDMGFFDIMKSRGYTVQQSTQCLRDKAVLKQLRDGNDSAAALGVLGTPSFALGGKLLKDVHSWQALEPALNAALLSKSAK